LVRQQHIAKSNFNFKENKKMMKTIAVRAAKITYPTGNKNFAVKTSFPAAFPPEESDPFLMCDYFGPKVSDGIETDPDKFQVGWHPHRGMDIVTYLTQGN
jgi:redox-sensitive bicupin YhaK (pirin superfamily)